MAKKRRPVKPVKPQSDAGEEEKKGLSEEETQTAMRKKRRTVKPVDPQSDSGEQEKKELSEEETQTAMRKKRRPVKPVEPQSNSGEQEKKELSEEQTQTAMHKKRRPVKPVEPQSDSGEQEKKELSEEETQTAMHKKRRPVKPVEPESDFRVEEKKELSEEETQTAMHKKRRSVKPVEPESDSGEEEKKELSEEETQTAMHKKRRPVKPVEPESDSGEEEKKELSEEEESGSESESEPDTPPSKVKPLATKSMEKGQKSDHGGKKSRSNHSPEPASPTTAKPSGEETVGKDAKKKKTAAAETSEKKPNPFQRLWSEEDVIFLLKGMLDYSKENKSDPIADLDAFHECIRKKLHIDFSRSQLQDKIRKLKRKFINNKRKSFSKPHEQSVYDLSKEIWGNEVDKAGPSGVGKTRNQTLNASLFQEIKGGGLLEKPLLPNKEIFKSLHGIEAKTEWQKLKVVEVELCIKELKLREAQANLVLDGLKRAEK